MGLGRPDPLRRRLLPPVRLREQLDRPDRAGRPGGVGRAGTGRGRLSIRPPRGWRLFAQMLTSAGAVLFYLAAYGAFGFYHLLPQRSASVFLLLDRGRDDGPGGPVRRARAGGDGGRRRPAHARPDALGDGPVRRAVPLPRGARPRGRDRGPASALAGRDDVGPAGYAALVLGLVRRELSPGEAGRGASRFQAAVFSSSSSWGSAWPGAGGTRAGRAGKTWGAGS